MELKDKVSSEKLSKEIFDLGWRLETEFSWILNNIVITKHFAPGDDVTPAPLACEIGEVLPQSIKQKTIGSSEGQPIEYQHGGIYYLYYQKGMGCFYAMNNGQTRLYTKDADTEANARAKMLIYLTEQGLIKPGKI